MIKFRQSSALDADRLLEIWRAAVDATHDFLASEDRIALDGEVRAYVSTADLWLGIDDGGDIAGFMGLSGSHMDALFVDPRRHGIGVGRAFVTHAFDLNGVLTCDVNEQNEKAVGFYKRVGFARTGRSATDGAGRPYPLIHMRLDQRPGAAGAAEKLAR